MCPRASLLVGLGLSLIVAGAQGQGSGERSRDDVTTLDGIIRAYYEIVSGPAGEAADRARDEYIHFPGALVAITSVDTTGTPTIQTMSIGEYHDRLGGPRQNPFYEWEIHRVTERFGNVAHVWSTYVIGDRPDGPVRARGINSIQLYYDGERWWVTSWIFDSERDDNPVPPPYLPGAPERGQSR